jgi:tripartite ATP-independent transporter DctM subunit
MAGAPLGVLIPPSMLFILYGILTETSIGKLFIAGIIPGVLLALLYMLAIFVVCLRKPNMGPKAPPATWQDKKTALFACVDVIVLIIFVLGGLMIGWFTPTEAGAIGTFFALIIALARRKLTWAHIKNSILETAKTVGMIYGILIGAYIFNFFVANTTIPMQLATIVSELAIPPMAIMMIIIVLYIVLGIIMDEAAMFLLTIPIFFPLVMSMGYDAIWFGVLATRMVMIGMITPPLGVSIYVVQGIAPDVPITKIYKGVVPFLISDAVHVALLMVFPVLATFLPGLMAKTA